MVKSFDWQAHYRRKRKRPLVTAGEDRDNKLKARQLAKRVERGRPSANARTSGTVRMYDAEELQSWADANGFKVANRMNEGAPESPRI